MALWKDDLGEETSGGQTFFIVSAQDIYTMPNPAVYLLHQCQVISNLWHCFPLNVIDVSVSQANIILSILQELLHRDL